MKAFFERILELLIIAALIISALPMIIIGGISYLIYKGIAKVCQIYMDILRVIF
jgi:uncharacterized membrane protein